MKLSDFILLNEEEKRVTVLHEGVLIAKRDLPRQLVFLFQLPDYYVEAYCNIRDKSIEEYLVFNDIDSLGPYLENIQIDQLIN